MGVACCAEHDAMGKSGDLLIAEGPLDEAFSQSDVIAVEQLGVHVPPVPGNISLAGNLKQEDIHCIASRYKAWLYLSAPTDPNHFAEAIKNKGAELVYGAFPVPKPPSAPGEAPSGPSHEQVEALLKAYDTLPRPLMVQCNSGVRAGITMLLWLAKRRGYTGESVMQLASDDKLKFYTACPAGSPMREWLMKQLPEKDTLQTRTVNGLIFRQLYDQKSSTFTYMLGCSETKEAVLIDPVLEHKDRDLSIISEHGLKLKYVINTHVHADHITSGGVIRRDFPEVKTVISRESGANADIRVDEGDKVHFGKFALQAIATPGHTDGCITWYLPGEPAMAFTGDALLIRDCGRTDFQQGCSATLYDSVHNKIFTLPRDTLVYPAHDDSGRNVATVDEERKFNPRFTKTRDEFIQTMANLGLPRPELMDLAVPSNMKGGL